MYTAIRDHIAIKPICKFLGEHGATDKNGIKSLTQNWITKEEYTTWLFKKNAELNVFGRNVKRQV